ncbi:MAG: amidohydrolase [Anaerofustis stercorihominis]|nr:amidohydrolase [Anaerofustis stercorihominis]
MKTLYVNGCVFTGELPLAEAFAVENDKFIAVGSTDAILALYNDGDEKIDLEGKFVCAGFNDSHMHVVNYGFSMLGCDLATNTYSVEQLIGALKDFIADNNIQKGEWVRGRGFNQDFFSGEKAIPTRKDLDEISTEHPICIVRCCGHALVVNSYVLDMFGIDGSQIQPDGGQYDVDENGVPTGVFRDTAMSMIYTRLPKHTKEDIKKMILRSCEALNGYGVTSAQSDDFCVFESIEYTEILQAFKELDAEGKLTVRVYEQSQFTTVEALQEFIDNGYKTGVGTEFFRIGPLKLLGDGSLGARTAYLKNDYADAPGERGLALFTQQQFDELIALAHKNDMQVAVHSIGDGILDMILEAYEKAFKAFPRDDHRSGIVHVQITRPDQLQKMKELSLHAYAQTIFIDYDAHIVEDRVGKTLADTSYAFHTLKEMGLHVSNGTDCPVEMPVAMRGIQCAVTRQPIAEDIPPYRPEEAMSVEEALRSYTIESAYASFDENVKGLIKEGYLADFVILSENPFETESNKLHTIQAEKTFVAGKKVWEK